MVRLQLPELWITSTLGSQLIRSDERIDPLTKPDEKFFYVGLEHIESNTGNLLDVPIVSGREIKSLKSLFHPGDILYGKLRPNLNKVYIAEQEGICSTDIWVLKAAPTIDAEYAAHYLRSAALVQRMSQWAIGANLPRVNGAVFDSTPIPLPPLPEQHRIVSIMREADELRCLRGGAVEYAQKLLPALFHEMFSQPDQYEARKLDEVCEFITKGSTPRDTDIKSTQQGNDIPFLKVYHITDEGGIDFDHNPSFISKNLHSGLLNRSKVFPGDVLMNIVGPPLGRIGLVPSTYPEWNINQALAIFRPTDQLEPLYLLYALRSHHVLDKILKQAVGVRQLNLSLRQCRETKIPIPPLSVQRRFKKHAQEAQSIRDKQVEANKYIDNLIHSLLAQAFTGELTARWRGQHESELIEAARERDALLSKSVVRGAARITGATTLTAEATVTRPAPPEREELVAALSRKQQRVLDLANSMEGYFTLPQLSQARHEASELSHADIRQGLQLLAALGLVMRVRVGTEPIKNELIFTPAYRRLLPSQDDSRLRDLERLGANGG